MNLTKELRRTRQRLCLAPEVLEDRVVLSAGQGSTFAIMPGSVTTAGPGLDDQLQDGSDDVHHAEEERRHRPRHRHRCRDSRRRRARRRRSSLRSSRSQTRLVTMIKVQHSKYDPKVAKANKLGDTRPRPCW